MKWPPVWIGTLPRMSMPSSSQRNPSDRTADTKPVEGPILEKKRTRRDNNDNQYFRYTCDPLEPA